MKLYYAPGACSLASHIALRESGMSFEVCQVDLRAKKTATGDDFLNINPKGYVPALQLDTGDVLTENAVILSYISDQKPEAKLAPAFGTMQRYHMQEWLNYIATEIHKNYGPLFGKNLSNEAKANIFALLTKRLSYVESTLAKGPYLLGDQFTVADVYLFVVVNWSGLVGFDLSPFPSIKEFQARVFARQAVQETMKAEGLIH